MMHSANNDTNYLPWHQAAWQQFSAYQKQHRLPHAMLVSGMPGLAKKTFAAQMATILLCENDIEQQQPCGQCFSCKLPAISEHPDYFEITPLEDSKAIKIEQIRELIESLHQTSHRIGNRIVIISPAEMMNNSAANALLKTLEEPGAGCYFLLISHAPAQLSATIRSRCQTLRISPDFSDETVTWVAQQSKQTMAIAAELLKQAEGAPQRAVELAEADTQQIRMQLIDELSGLLQNSSRLIAIAQRWQQGGLLKIIDEVIFILNQCVTQKVRPTSHADPALEKLAHLRANNLINYTQYIMQVKKELVINPNLNAQLLGETILLRWLDQVEVH